jgi:hypothetical protein
LVERFGREAVAELAELRSEIETRGAPLAFVHLSDSGEKLYAIGEQRSGTKNNSEQLVWDRPDNPEMAVE